ncbi:hypothetical protein QBC34DRAFT_26714 [Podospora aff. communis PSN243]|uniref:Stress-response A/B barrel domain-containing protein n=1 Tax=Podospora aff. communis PSN243 TaxID=3040156 RepID=A0AAV9GW82_9PEZI|nr:hypothetical protein QBC34DRAFT_26714 [Podospora aff. communis PSN243]
MLPKQRAAATILLLTVLLFIFLARHDFSAHIAISRSKKMSVTHVVLFQFKPDLPVAEVRAACSRFLALKEACIHPTRQEAYVLSLRGGKDHSPEGLQNGMTHGFVVEFASVEDRDYYVNKDPAHLAFVKSIEALVDKATVVDFNDGAY